MSHNTKKPLDKAVARLYSLNNTSFLQKTILFKQNFTSLSSVN